MKSNRFDFYTKLESNQKQFDIGLNLVVALIMANLKFKPTHPKDIKPEQKKIAVSSRINESTRDFLVKYAKMYNLSLSDIFSRLIYDYVAWLKKEEERESKKTKLNTTPRK